MAVASYLPSSAAHALAGRLKAEGIDARVTSQGDSLEPYRGPGAHSFARVIAPERDAARALWIVETFSGPATT